MYRRQDMDKIEEKIDKIIDEAAKGYKSLYEPTLTEISNVYIAIKEWIKNNKRIVYGGFAQNMLLNAKKPEESFYKQIDGAYYNWPDIADIEFYSPNPLADIINLTEELHAKGFKHIEGKEGIHPETYKIFVNFENYCDISYMPNNIYENLPVIEIDGIRCTHPHFMMVDAFRVMTDPMTSYWRLEKSLKRFQKIIEYYPIDQTYANRKIELTGDPDIMKFIRKKIIHKSNMVVVGFYAYNYYVKKLSDDLVIKTYPFIEVISKDLEKDAKHIHKILTDKYGVKITHKEFYPFYEFIDKHIEFYFDGKLILKLYGNNERCTVYKYSDKKHTHFGTFNLVMMYLLFNYFYSHIKRDKTNIELYSSLIAKFFNIRNKYLENNKITVVDSSPFEDFTFKCFGIPTHPIRAALLSGLEKKKQGKKMKFRYGPTGKPGKVPNYIFNNSSGNQILNEKYFILKK